MAETGNGAKNTGGSNEIDFSCVVHFRPNKNWSGEYGFDWFREKNDTPENNYDDIVGKYPTNQDPDHGGDPDSLTKDINRLSQLHNEYGLATIYPQGRRPASSMGSNYSKARGEEGFSPNMYTQQYHIPYITLYYESIKPWESNRDKKSLPKEMLRSRGNIQPFCKTKAKITAQVYTRNIEKIVFKCNECISVSPKEIRIGGYNGEDYHEITVTLKYDFNEEHTSIKAYAFHESGRITFAGQLNVLRCEPKRVNIHFISVRYRLNGSGTVINGLTTSSQTKEINNLRKYLSQANIIPIITNESFQLDDDNTDHTKFIRSFWHRQKQAFMVEAISYPVNLNISHELSRLYLATLKGDKRADYYKSYNFFFLGQKAVDNFLGLASGIPSNAAVIFDHSDNITLIHELLHCFGLYHSFSNLSKHTFKKLETTNIMDYSDDGYTLWRWQWERMSKSAYVNLIDLKDGNLRQF